MDFQQVIEARRSVRKFRDEEVPHEVLAQAIEAALHAPSSRNSRSTRFLAVRDAATVHRMAAMRDYGAVPLAGAPAAVVVMGDRAASDLWVDNAAIAATILQLALVDAGLKSCWVHVNGVPAARNGPTASRPSTTCAPSCRFPRGAACCASSRWATPISNPNRSPRVNPSSGCSGWSKRGIA